MKKTSYIIIPLALLVFGLILFRTSLWHKSPEKGKTPLSGNDTASAPCFLLLSDVHLNTADTATRYGGDTGMKLWESLKTKLAAILNGPNAPRFVIYCGDLPAHYNCADSTCYLPPAQRGPHNANIERLLTDMRNLTAKNKIPLFYAPGNNDALAGDYHSFADSAHKTPLNKVPETSNPYPALNTSFSGSVPPYMISDPYPELGFFSVKAMKGLRVIVLNSVIFGKKYWQRDGISQDDAATTQMAWLAGELKKAADAGDKVYLAMHIPPGIDPYAYAQGNPKPYMWKQEEDPTYSWKNAFLRLNAKYQKTIAGVFYGHTHMDEVRLFYDSTGTGVTEAAISCPGITPQHYNNPGFKIVYYNPADMRPTNFITYYSTPTAPVWGTASYSFSSVFHQAKNTSIYDCLRSQPVSQVNTEMDSVFTVMHGGAGYDTQPGIAVKWDR